MTDLTPWERLCIESGATFDPCYWSARRKLRMAAITAANQESSSPSGGTGGTEDG